MREVQLPRSAAVLALEKNGLNVDKAIRAIYWEKINNGLYAYIWGESGVQQFQNDRVKQMIKENQYTNTVSIIL